MVNMITDLFLADIDGNKMFKKVKKLHQIYKLERYKENIQFLQEAKTGISPFERNRLLNYPAFTEGKVDFFGKPFYFSHGSSFIHSVDEIFKDEIYKFIRENQNPYIIDCGANIGLSIAYFRKLFPNAEILAFEPDEQIFELLRKNVAQLPNSDDIKIEKKAVWTEDTNLEFFSEGALAGSLVTDFGKKNNIIKIQAVDFKKYLNREIDFLKIDIEGSENALIFHIKDKLANVKNLFLEYHGLIGEEQNLGEILNLLKNAGFQYYIRLAAETIRFPFCNEKPRSFNQQLNILCYRDQI